MMDSSELTAIRNFLSAAAELRPFCNDDSDDLIVELAQQLEAHVDTYRAQLEAERDALLSEIRKSDHRKLMDSRGVKVIKGGKL